LDSTKTPNNLISTILLQLTRNILLKLLIRSILNRSCMATVLAEIRLNAVKDSKEAIDNKPTTMGLKEAEAEEVIEETEAVVDVSSTKGVIKNSSLQLRAPKK